MSRAVSKSTVSDPRVAKPEALDQSGRSVIAVRHGSVLLTGVLSATAARRPV